MVVNGSFWTFCFSSFFGLFLVNSFIYRLFRAFLFTILFRHFVICPIDVDALHLACVAGSNEGFKSKEIVAVYEEITSIRVSVTIFWVLYQDAWLEDILFAFAYPREFESLLHIVLLFLFCYWVAVSLD